MIRNKTGGRGIRRPEAETGGRPNIKLRNREWKRERMVRNKTGGR